MRGRQPLRSPHAQWKKRGKRRQAEEPTCKMECRQWQHAATGRGRMLTGQRGTCASSRPTSVTCKDAGTTNRVS